MWPCSPDIILHYIHLADDFVKSDLLQESAKVKQTVPPANQPTQAHIEDSMIPKFHIKCPVQILISKNT